MDRETGVSQGGRTAAFLAWTAGDGDDAGAAGEWEGGRAVERAAAGETVESGRGAGCWPAECEFFTDTGVLVPANGESTGCQGEG